MKTQQLRALLKQRQYRKMKVICIRIWWGDEGRNCDVGHQWDRHLQEERLCPFIGDAGHLHIWMKATKLATCEERERCRLLCVLVLLDLDPNIWRNVLELIYWIGFLLDTEKLCSGGGVFMVQFI